MYCSKCGVKNEEDSQFCKKCGTAISKPVNQAVIDRQEALQGTEISDVSLSKQKLSYRISSKTIVFIGIFVLLILVVTVIYIKTADVFVSTDDLDTAISTAEKEYIYSGSDRAKQKYNELIASDIKGNTCGNLYNFGYVDRQGDWIYYSTLLFPNANLGLYKMRSDGTEKTKLCNYYCRNINVVGDWIYFMASDNKYFLHLYKIHTDGTDMEIIYDDMYNQLFYEDSWLYFDCSGICRIRTDGTEFSRISEDSWDSILYVQNGWIYFRNDGIYRIKK